MQDPAQNSMIDVQIDYASDDSCQIQLWAKGTHAPKDFIAACEATLLKWDGRRGSLADKPVRHDYWRTVRGGAETTAFGVCAMVRMTTKPGRGAYAVTILDDWLPLHPAVSHSSSQPALAPA